MTTTSERSLGTANSVVPVQLGHLGSAPARLDDPHHRLLYLPEQRVIVAVETRLAGNKAWRCAVIAAPDGRHRPHLTLTDADLAHASATLILDAEADPNTFALVWHTRVQQQWSGMRVNTVARVLATSLRRTGTSVVHLDATGIRELTIRARLRPPNLRILLRRLTDAGFLRTDSTCPTGHGTYTLQLPTGGR